MRNALLLTVLSVFINAIGFTQTGSWTIHNGTREPIKQDNGATRRSFPKDFTLYDLNIGALRQQLFSVADNRGGHSIIISIPDADGKFEQFEVSEASNFEPDLQAQFPTIRAFSGKGITDKYAMLKLSISPQGIQTIVFRTDKASECIEPYSQDHSVYAVFRSNRMKGGLPWICSTPESNMAMDLSQRSGIGNTLRSTGDVKTMRLAQSVTAEYSNYFGATSSAQVGLVLAAINATLTRCNGVYEKDLAVHLNLIAASTNVIYYNPATDPYDNASTGAGGTWNGQLQSTLTSVVGEANYDIGHLFGASGGGGNAGCIGCICTNGSKGSGFTSPADGIPQGDNFDIDYVVHEVGHQMGANHTFSHNLEGSGVNKEVGSGITIMGYAGITSQDVAPHSIDIFHEASIAQIQTNLSSKSCPVTTNISANNATPVVAAVTNRTIPISTPFALTGSATDANAGDALTYCWEQNDNATTSGAGSVASATKATGPNWLSFSPSASPTRTFPILATILSGGFVTGPLPGGDAGANIEALSSVSRTLNFRLTVRDNCPYSSTSPVKVGQTNFTGMVVTVSNSSGPFAVTSPNTAVTWGAGAQTVAWSVNNTTAAPVSCANVKISLSTDGGLTFPTVLNASTPNDGSETVTIPSINTTTARIKVEAVGNIFFDIGNSNFTISTAACGNPTGLASSSITTSSATVSWAAVSGAVSYDVDYKAASSGTWINLATATAAITANISSLSSGTVYDWRVRANCSASSGSYSTAQFTTAVPCVSPGGLTPSSVTSTSATVSWSAVPSALNYDVDYKAASSGTWINIATATGSLTVTISGLVQGTLYDWRVRTNCASGTTAYSTSQFTTGIPGVCGTVTGLSTAAITNASAMVSWTGIPGALSYDVDYKTVASGTWLNAASGVTNTSKVLSVLTASTQYDWRVRANCSGSSGPYTSAQFITSAPVNVCNCAAARNRY